MNRSKHESDVIALIPGLDPRQGGVQVSASDALVGMDCVYSVVYGTDPLDLLGGDRSLKCNSKAALVLRLLVQRWDLPIAVFWHCSMLRLLPFLRGFKGKKVVFLHGIEVWRTQSPSMLRRLRSVDLFLSNSDFTWNRFLEFAPELANHSHVTTALGFGSPVPNNELKQKTSSKSVLIIARMLKSEDYKGHRQLIQSWPTVLKDIPDAILDIVGEGDLKPELQNLATELGVGNFVRFHGRVSEAEKESLLRNCAFFAMPSRGEGFGIVYLEAMRYGRPCIVSNCDAAREVVNPPEAGLEVDPGKVEDLSNAIVRLLANEKLWEEKSAAARLRYEANYTVEAYQKRLWSAVDSVSG